MYGPEVVTPELATPAVQVAQGGGYGELLLTSLLVLALVGGAAWLGLRLVARWLEGRRVGTGVTVVGRVPLEPRRALYVVEAGGRRLLVGSSEGGVTLLTELAVEPGAPAVAAEGGRRRPASGRDRS
ncbi:MAG: FliO/MopB family protein [Kofleriaceae bacterium]|nr:FliO/MopB family protein [Kofleriaceae bacterium]